MTTMENETVYVDKTHMGRDNTLGIEFTWPYECSLLQYMYVSTQLHVLCY